MKNYSVLIFLFNPFLNLLFYLKNNIYKSRHALWFFCAFIGYTFVISDGNVDQIDASRYANELIEVHNLKLGLNDFYNEILITSVDPVLSIIIFLVSLFSNSYSLLFLVFGIIFGYFYSKLFELIIIKNGSSVNLKHFYLFFIAILLIIPPWQINGFRFWTGAIIFIYSVLLFIHEKNIFKSLLFMLLACAFHFTFILLSITVITSLIFSRFISFKFVYILFIANIFFGFLSLENINLSTLENFVNISDLYASKINTYTNQDYIDIVSESSKNTNFYVRYKLYIFKYLTLFVFFILLINTKINKTTNSFLISICLITDILLTLNVGAIERFGFIINFFLTYQLLLFLPLLKKLRLKTFLNSLIQITSLYYIIVELRFGFEFLSLDTFFSNPIVSFFIKSETAIITLVK